MRRWAVLGLWLGLSAGCGSSPSMEECQRLLDHWITSNAAVSAADMVGPGKKDIEARHAAVRAGLGPDFLARCQDDFSSAYVQCALKARTDTDLAACH